MKKITKVLSTLWFCGAILLSSSAYAAQGDGTGGGGGDGTDTGPTAPPGAFPDGPYLGIGPITMTEPKLDALFDKAEELYPNLFPKHQSSVKIIGYYARHYPSTNIYLGAKEGEVVLYGAQFGGILKVGTFKKLVHELKI